MLNMAGIKKCNRCQQEKPYSDFAKNKKGINSQCKSCVNKKTRERYSNDADFRKRISKSSAKWGQKNKKKKTEYNKAWINANPDKVEKTRTGYKERHKLKRIAFRKKISKR